MQKRRLGISLYPEHSTFEQDVAYLEKAVGCKIRYVSVGPDRDAYIDMN